MNTPGVQQSIDYSWNHFIGEYQKLEPGFRDGGRQYPLADNGAPREKPKREILVVKSLNEEPRLSEVIAEARAGTASCTSRLEKARKIGAFVAHLLHDNNIQNVDKIIDDLSGGKAGAEISLGQLIEARAGTCRHRSLLFKFIADALDVPTALVRGNLIKPDHRGSHIWNTVLLEDGQRRVFDTMMAAHFDLDDPRAAFYHDVRDQPFYRGVKPDQIISQAKWSFDVEPTGSACAYTYIDELNPAERIDLQQSLKRQLIAFDLCRASEDGLAENYRDVVRVQGKALEGLRSAGVPMQAIDPTQNFRPGTPGKASFPTRDFG